MFLLHTPPCIDLYWICIVITVRPVSCLSVSCSNLMSPGLGNKMAVVTHGGNTSLSDTPVTFSEQPVVLVLCVGKT